MFRGRSDRDCRSRPCKTVALARRKRDLLNIFGQHAEIVEAPDGHYRWRVFIDRENFKAIVAGQIDAITYTNFNNSVKDKDLHEMCREFWQIHRQYQEKEEPSHVGSQEGS